MNNIVANFNQILDFAVSYNIPVSKKRGIIREYIQSKFLTHLYGLPGSENLSFVGGTSLRLLRGLDRFSEDLDFDNLGLKGEQIDSLIKTVAKQFKLEKLNIEISSKVTEHKKYYRIKFPGILEELKISTNPKEKLMLKFDYSDLWKNQTTEATLFKRFGFVESIITNTPNQILVQKLVAFVNRPQIQPRDIYDIVWLYSKAGLDWEFANKNGHKDVVSDARKRFLKISNVSSLKRRLRPFLIDELSVDKIDIFLDVLDALAKTKKMYKITNVIKESDIVHSDINGRQVQPTRILLYKVQGYDLSGASVENTFYFYIPFLEAIANESTNFEEMAKNDIEAVVNNTSCLGTPEIYRIWSGSSFDKFEKDQA